MPIDDPSTWAQGFVALKTAFDSFRSAITLIKDVRSLGDGTEQQKKAIDNALTVATSTATLAEAQIAQAFGYELCKCDFPPTPMRTVGYFTRQIGPSKREGDPVYECPKCGYNTAGPIMYQRLVPERGKSE
jgi:hypothetical protein